MPKAVIVTLAEDVVDQLNKKQGGWSQTFKAVRRYQPKFNLEDIGVLDVQVVPLIWRKTPDSRSEWSHEYVIAIGIQYRAKPEAGDQATAKFDECLKLVEEISDYYEDTRPTAADCPLMSVEFGGGTGAPYAHADIETENKFGSVIHLTFRKYR